MAMTKKSLFLYGTSGDIRNALIRLFYKSKNDYAKYDDSIDGRF